jgi:Chromate transporter
MSFVSPSYSLSCSPNFNFSAYCGALALRKWGWAAAIGGAVIAWAGIFIPGLLTITGVLPLWHKFRGFPLMKVK